MSSTDQRQGAPRGTRRERKYADDLLRGGALVLGVVRMRTQRSQVEGMPHDHRRGVGFLCRERL